MVLTKLIKVARKSHCDTGLYQNKTIRCGVCLVAAKEESREVEANVATGIRGEETIRHFSKVVKLNVFHLQ